MNFKYFYIFIILSVLPAFSQQEEYITVIGDSLIGKVIEGESIREVYGDVVLRQGNVVITCDKAIQFISRNEAELIGNVVSKQDSLTIYTEKGFYYGNERRAESSTGVKLDDQKVILTADSGDYFFNEDKAYFKSNVKLYDTTATLTSNELIYFKNENRMIAVNNVKIVQGLNTIESDSLEYFRDTRITFAYYNIKISNEENNVLIFGDHLEDYANEHYTIVDKNPLLIQADTSYVAINDTSDAMKPEEIIYNIRIDTLVIKSLFMEAWRDTSDIFKATDSVRIVRSEFASLNDITTYFRSEDKIITERINRERRQPIIWYENSQLTGDSIAIHLRENQIRLLEVFNNSFLLSQSPEYPFRFDQISGERIFIFFEDGKLYKTEVYDGVLSIYYMYEEGLPNGLTRSSSQTATINIEDSEVTEVRLYGSPKSEYYPENQVKGKELEFTLPRFKTYGSRPLKRDLISNYDLGEI
jgi:lipopolysaccharide export system protein LptA